MPGGLEVTVPLPVPSRITARLKRALTVSVVLPLRPPELAVITLNPGLRPVANPAASIVATVASLLVHVTPRPTTVTGVKASVVVPFPSRPSVFRPQHCTEKSWRTAQVCSAPDDAAVAVVIPVTAAAGVVEVVPGALLLPSWPQLLSPQHRTVPSWKSAQGCSAPGATAAGVIPLTVVGVEELAVVPLPSRPSSFRPQHCSVPSRRSAQVWKMPASMSMAVVMPVTVTGVGERLGADGAMVAPSPSWP